MVAVSIFLLFLEDISVVLAGGISLRRWSFDREREAPAALDVCVAQFLGYFVKSMYASFQRHWPIILADGDPSANPRRYPLSAS